MKITINKTENLLLYLLFLIFPFYTVIRLKNIPVVLYIITLLLLILVFKVFIRAKIILTKTFLASFWFVFVYFILGIFIYDFSLKGNIRDFLLFLWIFLPLIFVNSVVKDNYYKYLKTIYLSSSLLSVLILLKLFKFVDLSFIVIHTHKSGLIRLLGIGDDPNANSFAILYLFILFVPFLINKKINMQERIIYFVLLLPNFVVFFLCESRAMILGIAFSLFILFMLNIRKINKKLIYSIIIIILVSLISILVLFKTNKLVISRLISNETSQRLMRWESAINIYIESPLIGKGLENVKQITSQKYNISAKNVHSMYLNILASTGIVGFIIIFFLIYIIYRLIFALKDNMVAFSFWFIIFTAFFIFNLTHSMLLTKEFWLFLSFLEIEYVRKRSFKDVGD